MEEISLLPTMLTIINSLIGIIMIFILGSIRRIEDRHHNAVKSLHHKVDKNKDDIEAKREKDLTEIRDKFEEINIQLAKLVKQNG